MYGWRQPQRQAPVLLVRNYHDDHHLDVHYDVGDDGRGSPSPAAGATTYLLRSVFSVEFSPRSATWRCAPWSGRPRAPRRHRPPQGARVAPKPLHEESRERLLAALPDQTVAERRDTALVLFLLSSGRRISQALRLDRAGWRPERMSVIGEGDKVGDARLTAELLGDSGLGSVAGYTKGARDPSARGLPADGAARSMSRIV
jgi:hypothetical protein